MTNRKPLLWVVLVVVVALAVLASGQLVISG